MKEKKINFQEAKLMLSLIDSKKDFSKLEIEQIQSYLKYVGYDLGTTGKNKDGIDGNWGNKTTAAVNLLKSDFNSKYSKDNSNQLTTTKTYNHTAESFVPMESIGAYNIGLIMGNVFKKKNKSKETNPYEGMSAEELIATNPKLMLQLLISKNYDLGKWKDDGNWGSISKKAWEQAQKDGWVLKDGLLIKTDEPSKKTSGSAFYISYPDHRISTSGTGLEGIFGKNIPLIKGHSASILIDDKGNAVYYTYGRYGDMGSYKSWDLPPIQKGETNESYLKRIRPYLEYNKNNESVRASYIPKIDYEKAIEYYEKQPEKDNYSLFNGNTCAGEACRGIDSGIGIDSSGIFDWFVPDTPENIHRINYRNYEKIDF